VLLPTATAPPTSGGRHDPRSTTATVVTPPASSGHVRAAARDRRARRAALRELLAPDVWFRALVVHELLEQHDVPATLAIFDGWFGHAAEVQVLLAEVAPAGSRELLRYRLRLRPHWAPDVWHVIEQTGYARVADGRVRRLDLLCTGFVPET
jgi:hypothetical protein